MVQMRARKFAFEINWPLTQPIWANLIFSVLRLDQKAWKRTKETTTLSKPIAQMWPLCKGKIKAKSDLHFFRICSLLVPSLGEVLWKLFSTAKGQIISKCLFGVFNFFQKMNENTSYSSKNEFIHSFFGRIHGLTVCFRN